MGMIKVPIKVKNELIVDGQMIIPLLHNMREMLDEKK